MSHFIDDIAGTFTRTFCSAANFRGLLRTDDLRQQLSDLQPLLQRHYGIEGYLENDSEELWSIYFQNNPQIPMIDPKKFTPLSTTAATAFSTYSRDEIRVKEAQQLKEISCEKVKYTTIQHDNISTSNSVIVYTSHGQAMGENFGEIHEIFIHMDQNLYFLVKSFGELRKEHKQYDPFQKHPDLRAKMLYEKDGCSFEIITFEDIISHAATM